MNGLVIGAIMLLVLCFVFGIAMMIGERKLSFLRFPGCLSGRTCIIIEVRKEGGVKQCPSKLIGTS